MLKPRFSKHFPSQVKRMLDVPQVRPFSEMPWKDCWAAAAEGKLSLAGARWTRAGSHFASAWLLSGGTDRGDRW